MITFLFSYCYWKYLHLINTILPPRLEVLFSWSWNESQKLGFQHYGLLKTKTKKTKHNKQTKLADMLQIRNHNKQTANIERKGYKTAKWERTVEMQISSPTQIKREETTPVW